MGLQRDAGRAKQGQYQQYSVHAAVQHEKTTAQLVTRDEMQLRKDFKGLCDDPIWWTPISSSIIMTITLNPKFFTRTLKGLIF